MDRRIVGDLGADHRRGSRDDGPGVPPEERGRVFDVFERGTRTPDDEGAGIGLAICHRIADRHGGSIDVADSDLGGVDAVDAQGLDSARRPVRPIGIR